MSCPADIATYPAKRAAPRLSNSANRNSNCPFGRYWQLTRLDVPKPEIRSSIHCFAGKVTAFVRAGVPTVPGALARLAKGPTTVLRMVERIIDMGDREIYLVQIAATTKRSTRKSLVSN